jgi:hypothetical protein
MMDAIGSELENTQGLTHMMDSMRKGNLVVIHDSNPITFNRKLGTGGTKTVYEALIVDNPFALAVPNTVDGVEKMTQKWRVALQEPANTERVREMGFFTNPTCEAMPVSINGVPFTVLKMARYQDLPFQVMDGKNASSSTVTEDLLPDQLDAKIFEDYFATITPDVGALINNGVRVGLDSLNVCLVDGKPRIFLSDLGAAKFEDIAQDDRPRIVERYISNVFSAFLNGLTEAEYQKHKSFFDSESFKFDNPNNVTSELTRRALKNMDSA